MVGQWPAWRSPVAFSLRPWGRCAGPAAPSRDRAARRHPLATFASAGPQRGPPWRAGKALMRRVALAGREGADPSLRAALVPLVTAAARALVEPARLRERGCAGLDGLAGAGGDARRAEQLLQKEVELARCDHTTSSCKLFCELCCAHPPTARARAYCGLYVLPATTALHSYAQAQQTCQHGKILPVAHGSASWAGRRSGKRPQCLACSSQWGWSGGRRDNSKALQFCQYM